MLPRSDDVRHMTDQSLAPFHRNRRRLPRKQRQHESSSKANRQLFKRNPPSSSGGIYLQISSPNTFTRNGKYIPPVVKEMATKIADVPQKVVTEANEKCHIMHLFLYRCCERIHSPNHRPGFMPAHSAAVPVTRHTPICPFSL
ncbi:unnamed protein product [Protopolystoma xenopodis]|uniref:Uncharacterized protein n=1 Tax=Protopolystoma xenopodis TaxID=117903 RepID=A0A448XHH4_9PLAT|nr:unnamed protein product [Protopolystoma xenopodis]